MAARREDGQALMEFVIFIPFLIGLLSLMFTVAGAINGSINQQKSARGYFYHTIKGNSTLPLSRTVMNLKSIGMKGIGMFSIGWTDEIINGNQPVAPCYQVNSLMAGELDDECKEPYNHADQKSRFIKVFTMYGVCGNFYYITNKGNYRHAVQEGSSNAACAITNQ